jgi:hypothetical protein
MKARVIALLFIVLTGALSMKAYATIGQEPYTGFDDVLIPDPALPYDPNKGQSQPWEIKREMFGFNPTAETAASTPGKWVFELGTRVYITHTPADRHTTPKHRAEAWIKGIASILMADYKLIEQGPVKMLGVPAIPADTIIEPYRFTVESNGRGVIDYEGEQNSYFDDVRYVQRFYILPISRDEVVTVRMVRRKNDDIPANTQFITQWDHFLKTLKREVANTRSTTQGSDSRTRRYYTHAFSFEIFKPDEEKGNQWVNELGAVHSVTWKTPQGEIGFSISIQSDDGFLDADRRNKRFKDEAKFNVEHAPALAAELKVKAPKMTYLEKPIGTATGYGHREDKVGGNYSNMEFETVYKPGKALDISLSGPKAAIDANEKIIYDWLARFKFLP